MYSLLETGNVSLETTCSADRRDVLSVCSADEPDEVLLSPEDIPVVARQDADPALPLSGATSS